MTRIQDHALRCGHRAEGLGYDPFANGWSRIANLAIADVSWAILGPIAGIFGQRSVRLELRRGC